MNYTTAIKTDFNWKLLLLFSIYGFIYGKISNVKYIEISPAAFIQDDTHRLSLLVDHATGGVHRGDGGPEDYQNNIFLEYSRDLYLLLLRSQVRSDLSVRSEGQTTTEPQHDQSYIDRLTLSHPPQTVSRLEPVLQLRNKCVFLWGRSVSP